MEKYIVEIIPHYYYFGLPSEPECSLTVQKFEYNHRWSIFPKDSRQVFDCCDRDLFKVVAECNKWFKENGVKENQVEWPDWCNYIKGYEE